MPVVRPLRGAIELWWPGSGLKLTIELLYMKPSPGVITPDDEPSEWVRATQAPSRSITLTWVVSGAAVGVSLTTIGAPAPIWARQCAARSLLVIQVRGTSLNAGSPRCGLRSANAAFIAMATR